MAGLKISQKELGSLKEAVSNRFKSDNPNEDPSVLFNSMPDSYNLLSTEIRDKVGFSISKAFLRDFFYGTTTNTKKYQGQEDFTFRESTLDKLSMYAIGKKWENFGQEIVGKDIRANKVVIYCGTKPTQEEIGQPFIAIESDLTSYDLFTETARTGTGVVLYVNKAFLKSKRPSIWLSRLTKNFFSWVYDLDLIVLIDKGLILEPESELQPNSQENYIGISSDLGRLGVSIFWSEIRNKFNQLYGDIVDRDASLLLDVRDYEYLASPKFRNDLITVYTYFLRHPIEDVVSLYTLVRVAKRTEPKDLRSIITDATKSDVSTLNWNFFCVIGFRAYLLPTDKDEMLQYFYEFNTKLYIKNKIIRIFSIPVSDDQSPKLNKHELWQLYQFIRINLLTEVETYIFTYNVNSLSPIKRLEFEQDYVVRKQILNEGRTPEHEIQFWPQQVEDAVGSEVESAGMNPASDRLYLAYPEESTSGNNRLLWLTDRVDIQRFCEDFRLRMGWKSSHLSHYYKTIKMELDSTDIQVEAGKTADAFYNDLFMIDAGAKTKLDLEIENFKRKMDNLFKNGEQDNGI